MAESMRERAAREGFDLMAEACRDRGRWDDLPLDDITRDYHLILAGYHLAVVADVEGIARAIRPVLARGAYQMPEDVLPYETQAHAVAEAVATYLRGES